MKRILVFFCALVLGSSAFAQKREVDPAEIIQSANEFLRENVDDSVLDALGVDAERTRKFLAELQQQFQGTYVYDLGALRETATQLLPVLQQFEETAPYAVWLQTHLDYFEVADKLRKEASRSVTNAPKFLAAPSPKAERKAWVEVIEQRPMPPLAFTQVAQLKKISVLPGFPGDFLLIKLWRDVGARKTEAPEVRPQGGARAGGSQPAPLPVLTRRVAPERCRLSEPSK